MVNISESVQTLSFLLPFLAPVSLSAFEAAAAIGIWPYFSWSFTQID